MKYIVDDQEYEVIINKKRIRNLYMRFKNNSIIINAPFFTSDKDIKQLIDNNTDYLRKMIKKDNKKQDNLFLGNKIDIIGISNLKEAEYDNGKIYLKDRSKLDEAYKTLAIPIFKKEVDRIYQLFEEDIPYPKIKIRKMISRWGVCNRKTDTITLNLELIKYDISHLDYVIIHELSHFIHFNHSHSFWSLVNKYCPTYKIIRKSLRE